LSTRRARALTGGLLVLALGVGLSVVGTGCDESEAQTRPEQASPEAGTESAAALPRVRLGRVQSFPDTISVREVGRLEPWRRLTISAEVAGRLKTLTPEVAQVAGGGEVATIDDERLQIALRQQAAALEAAEARVAYAESSLQRALQLHQRGQMPQSDVDRAHFESRASKAEVTAARAAIDDVDARLRRTRIAAPEGYRVTMRHSEPGAVIAPGQPLLTLIDDRRLRLRFDVGARELPAVRPGQEVTFEIKDDGRRFTALVVRAGPEADPRSGRFPVEVEVANEKHELLAGMVCVVALDRVVSDRPLIAVPRTAVREQLAQRVVFVVDEDDRIERRAVVPLPLQPLDPRWLSVSGVEPGEWVCLDRLGELIPGDQVDPIVPPTGGEE
ncbi:MAG: efflux RND transporter periplasmic adaptor subunit, partial [Planctomycetota bacterium]